jgi:hypothetical protein
MQTVRKLPEGLAIAAQSAEFWRRLAPELTISDAQPKPAMPYLPERANRDRLALVNDGFLHLNKTGLDGDLVVLSQAMQRIVGAGLPAAFIGVYDETWSLVGQLNNVLNAQLGGQAGLMPDFWAGIAGSGDPAVPAGRRRVGKGVFEDGTPTTLTVWLSLTQATPANGCLYAVPAAQDRNYGKPDGGRADASLPSIRALPTAPGDIILINGETYHWQARPARRHEDDALMHLSWEFQSRALPPFDGFCFDGFPYVPFETRLGILARQMPVHMPEIGKSPVWRAVQQVLANRFPLSGASLRV